MPLLIVAGVYASTRLDSHDEDVSTTIVTRFLLQLIVSCRTI